MERPPSARQELALSLACLAGALCLALPCCYERVVGGDLWWHLACGRLIIEEHVLPASDVFSYTFRGQPWLNHEWLAQVGLCWLWRTGGPNSLACAKILIILATLALTFWRAVRLGSRPWAAAVATVAAAYVAKPFLDIRPGLLSLAATALLLLLWEARSRRLLWAVPPLILLWANAHAGVIFGLIICSLFAADALLARTHRRPASGTVGLVWAMALPLLNPNGLRLYAFPFSYAPGSLWRRLHDWLPPWSGTFPVSPLLWPYLLLLVPSLVLCWRRGWRASALAAAAALGLALLSMRFVPLVAVTSAPLLALAATELAGWLAQRSPRTRRTVRIAGLGLAALAAVLGTLILAVTPWRGPLLATMTRLETFPVAAVDYLKASELRGRIFHPFGWGGYLMLCHPDQPVFIDQRANTIYSETLLADYLHIAQLEPGWREKLTERGCDLILWHSRDLLPRLLTEGGGWVVTYHDGVAVVLARAGTSLAAADRRVRFPQSPYLLYAQGKALRTAGDSKEAERSLLAAAPGVLAARNELASLYGHYGRPQEARRWLNASLAAYPYQMGLNLRAGRLARAMGRPWEARARWLAELLLFPYSPALRR